MQFFNTSLVLLNTKMTERTKKAISHIKCVYIFMKLLICSFFVYIIYNYFYIVYNDFVKYGEFSMDTQ